METNLKEHLVQYLSSMNLFDFTYYLNTLSPNEKSHLLRLYLDTIMLEDYPKWRKHLMMFGPDKFIYTNRYYFNNLGDCGCLEETIIILLLLYYTYA